MVQYITHNKLHRICNLIKCSEAISRLWSKSLNGLFYGDIREETRDATFSSHLVRKNLQGLPNKKKTKI